MPKLTRLARKALDGDEDAMDDLELMAPKGVLDDMSVEEFAEKMVNDEDFADEIYSAKGSMYGSDMPPEDYSSGDGDTITVGKVDMSTMDVSTLRTLEEAGLIDISKDLNKALGENKRDRSSNGNPGYENENY